MNNKVHITNDGRFIANGKTYCRYRVYIYKTEIKKLIIGWRNALKVANECANSLFYPNNAIEILNLYTDEIIPYEEALKRAQRAAISATT